MIHLLLDKILETGNKALVPVLEFWREFEYKKVQAMIGGVIRELNK
jgi:hypothetical protein